MGLKFKNDSLRARWWDYSDSGTYFITICTKDRSPFFGKVLNGEIELNRVGEIVNEEWLKTFELRTRMKLIRHNYVIMPDHFHAMITIGSTEFNGKDALSDNYGNFKNNQFKPQANNLASIIRGFKASVTMKCKLEKLPFCWQSRYYDVIIKTHEQFENVQKYILENPNRWESSRDAMPRVPTD